MNEPTDPLAESHRRSPLGWALMTASLALVFGLLGLLVYKVAQGNPGKGLVVAIQAGKKPAAPEFRLKVLWPHTETWPISARASLADGYVSLSELRVLVHPLRARGAEACSFGRGAPSEGRFSGA